MACNRDRQSPPTRAATWSGGLREADTLLGQLLTQATSDLLTGRHAMADCTRRVARSKLISAIL